MDLNESSLITWLYTNGGPAIRYRTARELFGKMPADISGLAEELLQSPLVNVWLDRLEPSKELNLLHSSKMTAYENVMGKMITLGYHSGMFAFDEKTQPFRDWLGINTADIKLQLNWNRPFGC